MIEGELLYFTPAEFVVMMELAREGPYSMMFIGESEIDDTALAQAFTTLFQRNLISQKGTGFIHSAKGRFFETLKRARFAVMMNARGNTAGCYVAEETLWLVECIDTVLARQFRVQVMGRDAIKQWLIDKDAFYQPTLDEESAKGLAEEMQNGIAEPEADRLLRLERYRNGGDLICTYELLAMSGSNVIVRREKGSAAIKICTVEAMEQMLEECFGKDSYDHCQCKGARP